MSFNSSYEIGYLYSVDFTALVLSDVLYLISSVGTLVSSVHSDFVYFHFLRLDSAGRRYHKLATGRIWILKVNKIARLSSTSPRRETVQESRVSVISPTSGSDNPEFGTEALNPIVREVLEKVFEARLRESSETL
ncbi:hypothetical protein PVK06_040256 [Gossypium arboreum]|uniref:Uncharacterized protein n=1 Tax=Gossypium arboreum TaxID=29729 RepID=A0ABR0N7S3_GOSAR|nr:hypothetical protein PVK06_040256 [Gossypium arboreum]